MSLRVGIYLNRDLWLGGVRYVENLVAALRDTPGATPVVIAPERGRTLRCGESGACGCETLDLGTMRRGSALWLVSRLIDVLRGDRHARRANLVNEVLLGRRRVAVTYLRPDIQRPSRIPALGWIPDFQHIHLVGMFSGEERERRSENMRTLARHASLVIVSSEVAAADFTRFMPEFAHKCRVVRFVVRVPEIVYEIEPLLIARALGLPDRFIYFPGQLWKHKNHTLVLEALAILAAEGKRVVVVCSGDEYDARHPDYAMALRRMARDRLGEGYVHFLGRVSSQEVLSLMRQSIAVLNPSLFEGWSTTVEEAKSLGKHLLLSELAVHREQSPASAEFFDPGDAECLAELMLRAWRERPPGPDYALESRARTLLLERVRDFGLRFLDVAREALRVGAGS